MSHHAGIALLAIVLGACRTSAVGQAPTSVSPVPLFGPVIGAEVIAGRADAGDITLLAGGLDLLRLDLADHTAARTRLALAPGESCWGLARLTDGSVWTLKGRHTVARVHPDGSVTDERTLPAPHFGIFAAGSRLVYQEAAFTPPSTALTVDEEGGKTRVAWSGITTRRFDRLARASAAALNMLSCGATRTRERACWFPDEPAVFLVDEDGRTSHVELAGLAAVAPETLLTSDTPARPVRDAYVVSDRELWVLSSGTAPPGSADTPGGWILARYRRNGTPEGQSRLTDAARLILRADADRITLLLSSGHVAEVHPW